MSESPYQSPQAENLGDQLSLEPVRRVARYQRWVLLALLVNIVAYILAISTSGLDITLALVGILVAIGAALFSFVALLLLARELMGTGAAIACAILMFMPCVSLFVLLFINSKATTYLQRRGLKVGFLGVDPNRI